MFSTCLASDARNDCWMVSCGTGLTQSSPLRKVTFSPYLIVVQAIDQTNPLPPKSDHAPSAALGRSIDEPFQQTRIAHQPQSHPYATRLTPEQPNEDRNTDASPHLHPKKISMPAGQCQSE
ncbi:hypothetical protein TcWFU_001288 [Taenia crassiceps]|uniref:Uncharacterized protein n=1 Tax=Taenia crassiceps TaxID=6207 RepID=A0ABR4QP02_9CEST